MPSPIQVAGKLTSGRAAVLTVAVAGNTTSLEWTVGSRGPYVATPVNGVLGRSIRLRFEGSVKVSVRAVGPGGTNVIARTLAAPAGPDDADARKVSAGEPSSASAVVALGPEDVLTGRSSACGPLIVRTGARTLTGCGRPIDELGDMPAGERGVLAPIAGAYRLNGADAGLMSRAVELLDGFVFDRTLAIDGLWPVTPGPGARLVAYPQAQALASSNASIRVAGQALRPRGTGFLLPVGSGAGDIELGSVSAPSGFPRLGGFPYAGDLDVALGRAFASIDTRIKLPDFATRNGIGLTPRASLRATPDRLIDADGLTYGPADVSFGPIPLRGFVVRYNAADDRWDGGMSACVFGAGCVDFQAPAGGIRLKGNELVYAKAGVDYGSPGRPLAPGIFLESGGFGFGLNPSRLLASARLGFGTFVKVDGREVLAWPSTSAPYRLARDEVGDAFPASLYASSFTNPLVAAGADLSVDLPVVGETKLAGGYLLFESGGYLALGGSASLDVLGVVKLSGSISGESSLTRVNVHGDIRACLTAVDDDLCAAAVSNVSRGVGNEGGAGAACSSGR